MDLKEAIFVNRPNRFVAVVEIAGATIPVHVPNSGRMRELLVPGRRVLVRPSANKLRKTAYSLELVDMGEFFVCINSQIANRLIYQALHSGKLADLAGYLKIIPEYTYLDSRFDFYLTGDKECYLEAKSVTLVEDTHTALFPDAPTARGRKHLEHLKEIRERGIRAGIIFVIQRPDAARFTPNEQTDAKFAHALRAASKAGVEIWAYTCQVTPQTITLDKRVEVFL